MQDRFKFRIWDKKLNKLAEWGDNPYHNMEIMNYICVENPITDWKHEDYILMQCTGLKDKNGKLIYEGDIVNGSCGVYWGKMIVEYNVAGFVLNKNGKYLNFLEGDNFIEVIGNIYENPELLKECEV